MWRVKDFQIHSKVDLGMMGPVICLETENGKAQANKESVKVFLDVEKTWCGMENGC